MTNSNAFVPQPVNEPILDYAPGSAERKEVLTTYKKLYSTPIEVPLFIGGEEIKTGQTVSMHPPHEYKHQLGIYHLAGEKEVDQAIDSALAAKQKWANMPWEARASIFLKAAELVAGPYRATINAATMLAQSKTCLLYTSPSPRDYAASRMPSSA